MESDMGVAEEKRMKLQKKNHFQKIKIKHLVVALAIAGTIIGGIAIRDFDTLKTFNHSKFNINDFDKVITVSFNNPFDHSEFNIEKISIEDNDHYSIKVTDGDTINASFDNAVLLDVDYKSTVMKKQSNELSKFHNAFVSYYNLLMPVTMSSLSIEKLNNKRMFFCDSPNERVLFSIENGIPYRILSIAEKTNFDNLDNLIAVAYIVVDGKVIELLNFVGYKNIVIDGNEYMCICARQDDGNYYEYLTVRDQVIFYCRRPEDRPVVDGIGLNYGLAKGTFNFEYEKLRNLYTDIKREIILTKNNRYHAYKNTSHEIVAPPRYYSFEYLNGEVNFTFDNPVHHLNEYHEVYYDQQGFLTPRIVCDIKMTKSYDTVLYYMGSSENWDPYTKNPNKTNYGLICSPDAIALGRTLQFQEIGPNYTKVSETDKFVSNLNGRKFGAYYHEKTLKFSYKFYAYKQVNIFGIDYYSLITELNTIEGLSYIETLVPREHVIIKGSEDKTGPTKVLSK